MTPKSSTSIPSPFVGSWLTTCLVAAACLSCGPSESSVAPTPGTATPGTAEAPGSQGLPATQGQRGAASQAGTTDSQAPLGAGAPGTSPAAMPGAMGGATGEASSADQAQPGDPDELPSLEELEAQMLTIPAELAVVTDPSLRLDTDPRDFPMPATVGGVPVRIVREYHPSSGVLMRIKTVREDSVDAEGGVVFHGPEWAYFDTAALSSIKWWKDNVSHGPLQHWRRVGTRKSEGRFKDGERDGLQRTFSKNGAMTTRGAYKAGRRVGVHEEWFASGQRMSVESYKNDQLDGSRRVWDRDGLLMQSENYVAGKRHGRWSDFHPADGDPREWGEFDSGVRTGVWERGSKEGVVLERSLFIEGRRDGLSKKWNAAGQLIEEVTYVRGVRTGPRRTWYDDGTLQSEGTLEEGLRTGYWRYQKANGELNELWSGEYAEDQRVGPGTPPK